MKILNRIGLGVLLSVWSISTFAEEEKKGFCKDKTDAMGYATALENGGVVEFEDCGEITHQKKPYIPHEGNNVIIEGYLSVVGIIRDSVVKDKGKLMISKQTVVYHDGFNPDFVALGENILIEQGSEVNVFSGGRLVDSEISGLVRIGFDANFAHEILSTGENLTIKDGGKLYVYGENKGEASKNSIESGGLEIVYLQGLSKDAIVQGEQRLQQGGFSKNTIIKEGGIQRVISGTKDDKNDAGVATGTTIESGGKQLIYHKGEAYNTQINSGGLQVLTTTNNFKGGYAENSTIIGDGEQRVGKNSSAKDTFLDDQAFQKVTHNGVTTNTTLKGSSASFIDVGASALGLTDLYDSAELQLQSSLHSGGANAENIQLNSKDSKVFILSAEAGKTGSVTIGSLNGGGTVKFHQMGKEESYTHLMIDNLEGHHQFHFNTILEKHQGDYITIKKGEGNHSIFIQDSGSEITDVDNPLLDLITDESRNAHFTLADINGATINVIDGGVYQFILKDRNQLDERIWYLTADQTEPPTEPEPPVDPPVKPDPPVDPPVKPDPPVDPPIKPEPPVGPPSKPDPPVIPDRHTTPSTDAVIAMSTASQMIFNNELNNLRYRRGELRSDINAAGVWGRIMADRSKVYPLDGKYTLTQTGIEFGYDQAFPYANGLIFLGGFINYSDNSLKHARGGKSSLDSGSIGFYGTYLFDQGFYLDAVVKYSHFRGKIGARSTNGNNVSGKYNQDGFGLAIEAGQYFESYDHYFSEPYARLSYAKFSGEKFVLNNEMKANIKNSDSFMGELGLNFGRIFHTNTMNIKPYGKVALAYEFIDNNDVILNDRHRFNPDMSGATGKYGIGIDIESSHGTRLFSEINYRKGKRVESSYNVNVGFEYSF